MKFPLTRKDSNPTFKNETRKVDLGNYRTVTLALVDKGRAIDVIYPA